MTVLLEKSRTTLTVSVLMDTLRHVADFEISICKKYNRSVIMSLSCSLAYALTSMSSFLTYFRYQIRHVLQSQSPPRSSLICLSLLKHKTST